MRTTTAWLVMLIALLAAACSPRGTASTSPVASVPSAATANPQTGDRGDLPADAVIVYLRSGGLAGVSEQWTIYPDGRVVSGKGTEQRVTAERVTALLAEIAALGFFQAADAPRSPSACRDCFTYQITLAVGGQVKTVTTQDGDKNAPAAVTLTLDKVNGLLAALPK